jgi:hypothetical protein
MKSRRNVSNPLLIAAATMVSALFLASSAAAKDDSREPALRAAEKARFAANVNADAKALGALLDDNLEYTHSNGELDSKTSFIASLTSGKRDYVATSFDIQSVRIFGDVAIVRGTAKVTVADNGNSRDLDLGYTDFWLWKDGRWQMTAWRSARMPPPAAK